MDNNQPIQQPQGTGTEDTKRFLDKFRKQISEEIRPLIPLLANPEDRVSACFSLLRDDWDNSLAQMTFDEILKVEDPIVRLDLLKSLLSEVSYYRSVTLQN